MKEEWDITGNDDVVQAAPTFVKAMEELDLKCRVDVWETPVVFRGMQTFPLHILYHLLTFHTKNALYDQTEKSQPIFGYLVGVFDWICSTSVLCWR